MGGRCSFHKPMRHLHAGGWEGEEAQGCWRASVRGLVQGQVSLAWHGGVGRGAPGGVMGGWSCWREALQGVLVGQVGGMGSGEGVPHAWQDRGRVGVCSSGMGLGRPEAVWGRSCRKPVS